VNKEGQFDPVDGSEQNNPGGNIIRLGKFLRKQEDIHHRTGSMGKGACKTSANTAGNTSQMRGAPGWGTLGNFPANKLPAYKTSGKQTNQ